MRCIKCDSEMDENVNFCPNCGFNRKKFEKELAEILKQREEDKLSEISKARSEKIEKEKEKRIMSDNRNNSGINLIVFVIIVAFLVLPIFPKENCVRLLGYNVVCVTQHVSMLQLILGR